MEMSKTLCLIGARGHYAYVLHGLESNRDLRLAGLSDGGTGDDLTAVWEWCDGNSRQPRNYIDYRDMLDMGKPDFVCVCAAFEDHAEMCIEAFKRGIHVLCEKPVALTLDDLDRLEAAHKKSRVHLASMMNLRYESAFYAAWQSVRAGAIGEIRLINIRKSYKMGVRPAYYADRSTYGGTIPWVGSHAIDLIHWFSGVRFKSLINAGEVFSVTRACLLARQSADENRILQV